MSQVYATEPSTSGVVLFQTSHGPLEMQLWCRECPTTTRLFLQLCLDGYFDDMVFHRIVPDFLIQTGAIRQSSQAKTISLDSTYRQAVEAQVALDRRQYEVHSRLKFNHRGQVAMALGISDDDSPELQPHFFITLDEAPYLDGKHVLFGTITGPTMFNALRIGRTETDESTHQPVDLQHAPKITSTKIVSNDIFQDLVPQTHVPWKQAKEEPLLKKKKKKRKGKKDFNVLSFGNELEDEDNGAGMKSSHDVVASAVLSKQVDEKVKESVVSGAAEATIVRRSKKEKEGTVDGEGERKSLPTGGRPEERAEAVKDSREERKEDDSKPNDIQSETKPKELSSSRESKSHRHEREKAPDAASAQSKGQSAVEARLAKYKRKMPSKDKKQREEDTMSKLLAFQGKVRKQVSESKNQKNGNDDARDNSLAARMARKHEAKQEADKPAAAADAPTYHGQVLDDSDDDKGEKNSWLSTKFKCRKHMDHSSGDAEDRLAADGRSMNEYEVVDEKRGDEHHRHRKRHRHHSSHRRDRGDRRHHRQKDH